MLAKMVIIGNIIICLLIIIIQCLLINTMLSGASQVAQVVKNPPANAGHTRDTGLIPRLGGSPWSRKWQPTPVLLPGESTWTEEPSRLQSTGSRESGTTELLSTAELCCINRNAWWQEVPLCSQNDPTEQIIFSFLPSMYWFYFI